MPAPRQYRGNQAELRMQQLKGEMGPPPSLEKDEFGRLISFTGNGFLTAGDRISYNKGPAFSGAYGQAGMLVSYGATPARGEKGDHVKKSPPKDPHERKGYIDGDVKARLFAMDETTMPGDLLVRKSGLPIKGRMAALVRQRSLDLATVILDFLARPGFSRVPPRGHGLVDIHTFRRSLCYAFGEQWSSLGMTSGEFMETYSPYIAREQTDSGDALILWKHFCADLMKFAGVDKGDLGYLKEEVDLEMRVSATKQSDNLLSDEAEAMLRAVVDAEFSHDIETEEEAQALAATRVERVTGARSVAVTRYGSYEAKLHGRNSLGVIKQGASRSRAQSAPVPAVRALPGAARLTRRCAPRVPRSCHRRV